MDKEFDVRFIFNKPYDAFMILDGMLVEDNIYKSIKNAGIIDMYVKEEIEIEEKEEDTLMLTNDKQIEEMKCLMK